MQYEILHEKCKAPFDGIIPLIEKLKAKGIIVALITGKGAVSCDITLKKLHLDGLFSDVITGSEFKNCKAESISELMKKYNLSPEECCYVGDTVSDVVSSSEAGIKCFSAAWSEAADKDKLYKVNAENVFESISELNKALSAAVK